MRYFIRLAYNGGNYCGWQIQPNGITIQETIESAFTTLLRQPIQIIGAGRTDAGVHASEMVAHFEYALEIVDSKLFVERINRILPRDIVLFDLRPVRSDAHARFDAIARTYKYYITDKKDVYQGHFRYKYHGELDFDLMNQAALILYEYNDFTSFSKLHTDVATNNCTISHAQWTQENDYWVFTICADRFLRNMVRAIVGTLLDVGRNKRSLENFRKTIELKDRSVAGSSVPGNALFLTKIEYPSDI